MALHHIIGAQPHDCPLPRGTGAPNAAPLSPIGAPPPSGHSDAVASCSTGGTGAPSASTSSYDPVRLDDHVTRACVECDGAGEVELLALDATRPVLVDCDACNGSGETAPRCDCGEPVSGGDADGDGGVCHACCLAFHREPEAREPTDDEVYAGWAVAERYALYLRGEL